MFANNLAALLPLAAFALAFALRGGRESFAFAAVFLALAAIPLLPRIRESLETRARAALPFLLVLLWCVVGLVDAPPLARHLYRFSQLSAYMLVLISAMTWSEAERRRFMLAVAACAVIDSLVFLARRIQDPLATGLLVGNPSYSGLLCASGFLAAIVLSRNAAPRARLAAALCGLLVAGALVGLQSRSSLIGLLASLCFVLPRKRAYGLFAVAAAAAVGVWMIDADRVMAYLKIDLSQPQELLGRLQIWRSAIMTIKDKPVLGWGLGNFEAGYLLHQLPVADTLRFDRSSPFAHNDYLQIAAEAGLPALGFFLWGLVRFFRQSSSPGKASVDWARAVVTLFAISALFNFAVLLPLCGMIGAAALGFGLSAATVPTRAERSWVPKTAAVVAGILGIFLILNGTADILLKRQKPDAAAILMPLRADVWYASAMARIEKRDWIGKPDREAEVFARLRKTVAADTGDAFAWNRLGVVAMSVMTPPVDARAAFDRALARAPMHAPFWVDSGFERMGRNDLPGAWKDFNRAATLEPHAPIPRFAEAIASARVGEKKQALALVDEAAALRRAYVDHITPSGYSSYLFGLTEEAMRRRVSVVLERENAIDILPAQ